MATRARLLQEALKLPEKDRADLAGRLILSLHPQADEDVEKAWAAEIERRLDRFPQAKADSVTWSEAKRILVKRQRARTRRKAAP